MEQCRDRFLSAMRRAACGVTVVTTDGEAGLAGLTVSAMCSLSADPPSLLVCINRQSRAMAILRRNGVFCVNVLSTGQVDVARSFGGQGRARGQDRFTQVAWRRLTTGAPAFSEAVAVFDCRIAEGMTFGSHDVLIGVVHESLVRDGEPLVYSNRSYGRVTGLPSCVLA